MFAKGTASGATFKKDALAVLPKGAYCKGISSNFQGILVAQLSAMLCGRLDTSANRR